MSSSPAPEPSSSEPTAEFNPDGLAENEPTPAFGWTVYAERINGRFAMIGFLILIALESLTHQDLLTWLGLR